MATTAGAVRDRMISLVEDITPAIHAQQKLRAHREQNDFREASGAVPGSCLRRFSITFLGDTTQALVTDYQTERVEETVEVVIAYPTDWRHGGTQQLGLHDVMASDAKKIDATIGVAASDSTLKGLATIFRNDSKSREDAGPVQFSVIAYRIEYARSLA